MTPIDLRIKYKSETGHNAAFADNLTAKYTEWLESNPEKDQKTYKRDTGNDAVYWHKKSEKWVYNKEYRLWLEDFTCEAYSILETLKQ
jgi:hypothetical protein